MESANGQTGGNPAERPDLPRPERVVADRGTASEKLFVPAASLMDNRYRAELGRTINAPRAAEAPPAEAGLADCQLSCDAFVPRQPLVTVGWAPVLPTRMPGAIEPATPELRLDVAATAGGFERAEFGTIPLRNVPKIKEPPVSEIQLPERPEGQILLNMVRGGRVVERSASLPVFRSPEARTRAMASLPAEQVAEVESDLRLGGLNQIRVLGMTTQTVRGQPREAVSMLGLQPGMTYRIRVVNEADDGARTVAERVCRVPVCPADFVDSPQ